MGAAGDGERDGDAESPGSLPSAGSLDEESLQWCLYGRGANQTKTSW